MLQLIMGTAGTGKTTLLHERIETHVQSGGKAILLVPEQYSFESEKALYRRLGPQGALSVEVLSFTRFYDSIFRTLGGIAGVHMDDTAKYLLMSVALSELSDALSVYQESSKRATFAADLCDTISELKAAGVSSDLLRVLASDNRDTGLSDKLSDIALIFDAYQAIVERGYNDPDDSPARACRLLESGGEFLGEHAVFVDGFMAFMGAEWSIIEQLLSRCAQVTVALTCTSLGDKSETGVFSAVTKTANRLVETAKKAGSRVAAPLVLRESRRYQNAALRTIAQELPKQAGTRCENLSEAVCITGCADIYDELEWIAAHISELVREQGYRYREICLIARSLERYIVPLQTVFARYDIPFFTDLRTDIQVYPLISGVLSALDAVRSGFDTEHLLALSKNCISGISCMDAAALENYCYVWGISGAAWTQPFRNNPDGMEDGFSQSQQERLKALNTARECLIVPLMVLQSKLLDCDGRGFAAAIFCYLEQVDAAEHLQESADAMGEVAGKEFIETGAQVWDILIGLLDVFGGALAGICQPLVKLIDLLRMSIATADVGALPQTLDQVIVGTADRIRPNEPKAVFVIGLNEGIFPQSLAIGGIFSASERDYLGAQGVDLLRTPEQYALFEQYFVYFALTQASQRLWLTYPQRDTAGNSLSPSAVLAQIKELVGAAERSSSEETLFLRAVNEKTAFDMMTRGWREHTTEQASLRSFFHLRAPERMQVLEEYSGSREFRLLDTACARALFGADIRLSPSRAERYAACPFSYFCQAGLGLRARRRAEFNPIESGSLIHLVLEKIVSKYGGKGLADLDEQRLREEIEAIIRQALTAKIMDMEAMSARFKYLFGRLVNTLVRLIKRLALEFSQSEFEPAAFELPIRADSEVKPLSLQAPDGTRVIVEGVVDRVDILRKNGVEYVRVVDYKSGRKSFDLTDVYYGLNLQMLIYLFSICDNAAGDGMERLPAGVLYMPARDSIISAERSVSERKIQEEQLKRLRMNGILLEDREVLCAMEQELSGVFIPVKTKTDGSFSAASSLANLSQMGLLKRQVERRLLQIASELHKGEIAAAPVERAGVSSPCGWCDYHSLCAHEEQDTVRRLTDLDKESALELMRKEEEDVG